MEKNHPHPRPRPRPHLHHHQQPRDFFNVFSENYISKGLQDSSSSSSSSSSAPNLTVSTELSLSSSFPSSSVPSLTSKTRTKHTHQYFPKRNTNNGERETSNSKPSYTYFSTEKEESHHKSNISLQSSSSRGCSTALKLYDDPWKIKKVLTTSDLGKLNRLLLSTENSMEDLVVSLMGNNNNNEDLVVKGRPVRVWDVETKSMHQLILKQWASIKNYVLIGNWNQDFVKRRNLKKGDEIGLQWDPYNFCFNFSVLRRLVME